MPIAELKYANVYYESTGSGPPLVFAHGAAGNALSWWEQIEFFGVGYRCITFDHPGFRHSHWNVNENDSGAIYANVLLELLDYLAIEQVGLISQSMGGWTCLRFALDHPDRVAALVLAATDGGLYLPEKTCYVEQEDMLADARLAWVSNSPGAFHPAAGKRMLEEQTELHEMYVMISRQNDGVSRRGWGQIDPKELTGLECPTLLIVGEEDGVCAPGRIEALARQLDRSNLLLVPESGHSVYFERAELFNRAVDEFLAHEHPFDVAGRTILESFTNSG